MLSAYFKCDVVYSLSKDHLDYHMRMPVACYLIYYSKYSETSIGAVVILPLVMIGQLELTFSGLKQLILDQTRQNGYQTIPFSVYIHNLMFVFIFDQLF